MFKPYKLKHKGSNQGVIDEKVYSSFVASTPKLRVQIFCWFIAFENDRIKKTIEVGKLEYVEEYA